jgi:Tfp pilus assembly protein PilE
MKIKSPKLNKGFTLVELLITLGFVVVGTVAITGSILLIYAAVHFIGKYW